MASASSEIEKYTNPSTSAYSKVETDGDPEETTIQDEYLSDSRPVKSDSDNKIGMKEPIDEMTRRSLSLHDAKSIDIAKPQIDAKGSDANLEDFANKNIASDIDILEANPGPQYPSPSSGFVPPVTQEDFRIPNFTPSIIKANKLKIEDIDREATPTLDKDKRRESNEASFKMELTDESGSSIPLPIAQKSILSKTGISRDSSSLSLLSSSSSSSSFDDGHSQAISARSSPSTVAPQRRRSSASPTSGNPSSSQMESNSDMIPIKIRDYAFGEIDPRHVGAKDITVQALRDEQYRGGGFDDEEEDEGAHNAAGVQEQGLPIGLYHAAYDFAAESEHELSVQAGEKLRLIGHVEGGWAIVIRIASGQEDEILDEDSVPRSDKGLVPEAYLEWLS